MGDASAGNLETVAEAQKSLKLMNQVKTDVRRRLLDLILEGQPLLMEYHEEAVRESVEAVRQTNPDVVGKWRYFAKVEGLKRRVASKPWRVPTSPSLNEMLKG